MSKEIVVSACERCHGAMQRDEDEWGTRMFCLICGRGYEVQTGPYAPYAENWGPQRPGGSGREKLLPYSSERGLRREVSKRNRKT